LLCRFLADDRHQHFLLAAALRGFLADIFGAFVSADAPRPLRMIEKETQHFLGCIRPLSVRIGSGRATSGPGMAGAVDIPVLQDLAFAVGVSRTGIPMPSRNLPAMHLLSCRCRSDGMFDNLGAVV